MKKIEIYKITNLINDKCYIGQTSRGTNVRFTQHCSSKSIIGNAIRKYGKENFTIETLYTVNDNNMADMLEEKCVEKYHSYGENGYNGSCTGKGVWNDKKPISFLDTYVKFSNDKKWYIGFTIVEKGRLFGLIRHVDISTRRIKYGDNVQQYCRTWKDLENVLNCSYSTLKQKFIKKIKDKKLILLENGALVFNKEFISKGSIQTIVIENEDEPYVMFEEI